MIFPDKKSQVLTKQAEQKEHHDRRSQERDFFVGESVMAKNLRPGPDWVPAVVVERLGPLTYLVETTDRLLWKRHIDLLRELCVRNHITEDHNSEELGDLEGTADPEAVMPPAFVSIPTVPESVAPGVSASVAPRPGSPPLADSPMQSASAPSQESPDAVRAPIVRQYPSRQQQRPDRFIPG